MDGKHWQRITEAFDAALELPAESRRAHLDAVFPEEDDLRAEVLRLLANFEKAGDFLDLNLGATSALATGDLVADRYEIQSLLGRGGMGEVYRAYDRAVGEPVALKTLRREYAADERYLRVFRREVQLARRVTHINICRVYEFGNDIREGQAFIFLTMQLLEGETLAARLHTRGKITQSEALLLIEQICEGLEAAHGAGVVHRDFKSSNVMICDGRVVITDFGLAHAQPKPSSSTASRASSLTQMAGTLAYMSPEQLAGGKVTSRSDIYSLGVVIFETITGKRPFDDSHALHSVMQRSYRSTIDVQALAPGIGRAWAETIARCLHQDPEKRFAGAADVVRSLRNEGRTRLPRLTRRQWTTAVAGSAGFTGAVALVTFVSRFYYQDARIPAGAEVLVSSIANTTSEERFSAITELFRSQLSQSVHMNLVGPVAVTSVLRQMGKEEGTSDPVAAREAAWRLNAGAWITGSISRVGVDYLFAVQVETRGSNPNLPRAKNFRAFSAADGTGLMRAVRDASVWVREITGESSASIGSYDRLPADVTTPSWEALAYYARGERFFFSQDYESALLQFEEALRLDAQFTLAAFRRADLLVSRGRQTEGFPQWRKAIQMLSQRRVTRTEELHARAMFAFDSGDMDANDAFCRTWMLEYPADWQAPYSRIIGLILNGHSVQALELLEHLRTIRPGFGDLYAQTIAAYLVLGDTNKAREYIPALRSLNSPQRADLREGFARFRDGDTIGFLEILRSIQGSGNRRSAADALLHEAMLCVDVGVPAVVPPRIDSFLSTGSWSGTEPERVQLRAVQAWAEILTSQKDAAVRHAREALESETGPVIVALSGCVFARAGAADLARKALKLCSELLDINLYRIAYHRIRGELAMSKGQTEMAIEEFRSASHLEPRIAHRQYLLEALPESDPDVANLCGNIFAVPWQALRPPPLHNLGSLAIARKVSTESGSPQNAFARSFSESARRLAESLTH